MLNGLRHRLRAGALPIAAAVTAAAGLSFVGGSAAAEPKPTLDEARTKVATLQHEAEEAGEAANDLTGNITASRLKVAALNAAVGNQQRQVDTIGRQIGALAVANYQRSQLTTTAQLLLSADPDEFLRQASTAQAFTTQQTAILRRYQSATGKLADLKAGEEGELRVLAAVQAQQNTLTAKIATNLAAAEKVLAKLTDAERDRLAAEDAAEVRQEEAEAEEERRRTSRDSERTEAPADVPASGRAKIAVEYALDQIGDPYVWAAAGPDSYDCSGLTMAAWGKAGVSLSHSSKAQYNEGRRVSRSELLPGDLLFYYTPISHVSMYIGNGKAVHASRPGKPVKIDPAFGQMPYVGAVRPG
jgi:cell wall-associated NlpC family hydrolase